MDAAALAAQSDPIVNRLFSRRWSEAPQNRKGRPAQAAPSEIQISGTTQYSAAEAAAQRALSFASRRAAHLDRTADLLLSVGQRHAAERLSHRAAAIREVLA